MDATDLARWQFAITTVYHFLFVPITIGLSGIVALFHVQWLRTRKPEWLRLTKFFGKLFTINFALGLVTGIVQEFQFGMNWSDYSRFVGDIFGAPLAVEALLAFFLESVFLGLWIFGWGRIPEKLHAATMGIVHIGTVLSAYFILSANSFMQHPVGYTYNQATGRAELTDFFAVLTNKVQLITFPHVIFAAYMVGGAVVMGVALHLMRREALRAKDLEPAADVAEGAEGADVAKADDVPMYRKAARIGAVVTLIAGLGVAITGDIQGKIMTEVQPMKMAAAEALYGSVPAGEGAPFSVLTIGSLDGQSAHRDPWPAQLPRDRRLQRSGPGHRGAQAAVRRYLRRHRQPARRRRRDELRAQHSDHVLDLPSHDRGRHGRGGDRRRRPVAHAPGACPDAPLALLGRRRRAAAAGPR